MMTLLLCSDYLFVCSLMCLASVELYVKAWNLGFVF